MFPVDHFQKTVELHPLIVAFRRFHQSLVFQGCHEETGGVDGLALEEQRQHVPGERLVADVEDLQDGFQGAPTPG